MLLTEYVRRLLRRWRREDGRGIVLDIYNMNNDVRGNLVLEYLSKLRYVKSYATFSVWYHYVKQFC